MPVRTDPATLKFSGKKPTGPLSDNEITSFLYRKINHALNDDDGELSEVRERLLSRYRGDAIGTETVGRSRFRTREVYETVEGALPGLLSLFFSAKTPIQFVPRGPEDVAAAKQETEVVDHYLLRQGDSYVNIHHFLKSAFLDPVAYVKVHAVHVERSVHHRYTEVSQADLVKLTEPTRVWAKGLKIEPYEEPGVAEPLYHFEGEEIKMDPEFYVEAIPPEQVLVDQAATDLDLDTVWNRYGFIAHRTEMAFTELVKRGYDPQELDEAGGSNFEVRYNDERTNRQNREDERPDQSAETDYSTRLFTVYECYVKMDCDGTGTAQSWKIVLIGNTIFEKVKVSYQPFVALSLVPMPFKHAGLSPAEAMEDLQELKTKLMRIALDDQYRNEERRVFMDKNAITPRTRQQMADPLSTLIEVKGSPNQGVWQEQRFSILEQTLAMIQYADDSVKRRVGMAPDVMLNPDVLRDATAHGLLGANEKSSARLMHYGRIAAEAAFKKIGAKLHALLRMHTDRVTIIQAHGEFIEFNPADWSERGDMKVVVGLGFNSKEARLQALTQILTLQREAMSQGLAKPEHLKHTLELMIEYADLGFYTQFFADPTAPGWQPPPPQPDPQLEAVKMQQQVAQAQEETKRAQIAAERETAQAKTLVDQEKVRVDAQRISADANLKRMQAKVEAALVVEQREAEIQGMQAERAKTLKEIERLDAEIAKLRAERVTLMANKNSDESEVDNNEA